MNNDVLYLARRTILTKRFVGAIAVAVVGLITMILGFVMMGTGVNWGWVISVMGVGVMLIAGLVALIEAVAMRSNTIEFYEKKYIIKSGVLNKHESEALLTNLVSVSVSQTLGGSMFNYGNVSINVIGKHDIRLTGVKNPHDLKHYIEGLMNKTDMSKVNQVIHE